MLNCSCSYLLSFCGSNCLYCNHVANISEVFW
nr:MAG TPA: 4Fe-4S single cluster domain protein [Caudoviricetes sp.]